MTQHEIFEQLRPLIREVTGVRPDQSKPESVLVRDLGAESIDLLDLSFLIEERFAVTIEPNEFERAARARIPGGVYEKDGFLTDAALAQLRRELPEIDQARLVPGLRKLELPALLTVSVFVRIIHRKLMEKPQEGAVA